MLIGNDFDRLERRITAALCSGSLSPRESEFLQSISRKIGLYRERTFLSGAQEGWLFTILTRFERSAVDHSPNIRKADKFSRQSYERSSPDQALEFLRLWRVLAGLDKVAWTEEEKPEAFDLSKAIEPDNGI